MIPTLDWAKKYRLKVTRMDHTYKGFLKSKVTELANKHIVDPIVESMRQHNVHRKIYESVVVDEVTISSSGIKIRIKSEFFSEDGFDVALAREKGTEDHMIRPKDPAHPLSWIQGGVRRYSAGHKVSGLPNLNLIERGVEKGEYELQQALNREVEIWRRSILG